MEKIFIAKQKSCLVRNFGISLILLLAFFLRIVNISSNPPSMYGDELTMVLDINSILHTGRDITGKFFPLNFTMGGGRPVGYGYFSMPFVALFGPGALSIRLLSVISGMAVVLIIFFLGKLLFSKQVGLFAAGLVAVSPWDLTLSRGGFETHFACALSLLMILTFLLADKKPWLYIFAALSFGLAFNTYNTYKLTLPILFPLLLWFSGFKNRISNYKARGSFVISVIILTVFFVLFLYQALVNNSESRFLNINAFAQKEVKTRITLDVEEQRNISSLNPGISRFLNNSYLEYMFLLGRSYLNNFSLDFLFFEGDKNPRQNMAAGGSLYVVELISIIAGFVYLIRKNEMQKMVFITGWLLIAPIAGSLLLETHALRNSFMLPPLVILSALGLYYIWNLRKIFVIKLLVLVLVLGFTAEIIFVMQNVYFISLNKYSRFWAYSAKLASQVTMQNRRDYSYIFISDRIDAIEFGYPVYAGIDAEAVLKRNESRVLIGGYKFQKYGNVYLGPIPDSAAQPFLENLKGRVLYIGPAGDTKYLTGSYSVMKGKDNEDALVVEKIR